MLAAAAPDPADLTGAEPELEGTDPRRSGAPGPPSTTGCRHPQRAGARARRHAPAGARLDRVAATRPSCACPWSPRCPGAGSARTPRVAHRAGSAGANSAAAGPSRAGPTWPTAASASAPNTSPASSARPDGGVRASSYHSVLGPEVIDDYRLYGYCLVMTVDMVRDRALQTGDAGARAYYERIEDESRLVREFSPYDEGAEPPCRSTSTFSYNYYPPEYHRRARRCGYRLDDCEHGVGPPVIRIPRRGARAGVLVEGAKRPQRVALVRGRTSCPGRASQSVAYSAYIRPRSAHRCPPAADRRRTNSSGVSPGRTSCTCRRQPAGARWPSSEPAPGRAGRGGTRR